MSARSLWLWLASRGTVSPRLAAELLSSFGTVERIYAADRHTLTQTEGLTKAQVDALCNKDTRAADRIAADCDRLGVTILAQTDAGYPDRLRQIADPPVVLYVRGALPDLDRVACVSVVGKRKASAYGLVAARKLSAALSRAGFVIVSGMAAGVDGAANRAAIEAGGTTVAVLGCGIDVCYPPEHRRLMEDIALSGALVSEYPPGTPPERHHFPARNRIISGMTPGTLVIEAGRGAGSLITADCALEQGRDVFAVPGLIDMPSFEGSNDLIASGAARLVQDARPIIREYAAFLPDTPLEERVHHAFERQVGAPPPHDPARWERMLREDAPAPAAPPPPEDDALSDEERAIVAAVRAGASSVDEIVERSELSAPRVSALLTMLELDGVLTRAHGRLTVPDR
ncbi:MAG: DNA-protecting protein DprA [Clostridia bacterium]|nr:DNA-protecting protein DprA [Clostridia bacterium]